MLIASQLERENRAGYILYLFQVEDLLRAYGLDADRVAREYVSRFNVEPALHRIMAGWYANLCIQMQQEGVQAEGHLSITRDAIAELTDLHHRLLNAEVGSYAECGAYKALYREAQPDIVALRAHRGGEEKKTSEQDEYEADNEEKVSDVEICLEGIYGVTLLRLQHREVSPATAEAAHRLGVLVERLSEIYNAERG